MDPEVELGPRARQGCRILLTLSYRAAITYVINQASGPEYQDAKSPQQVAPTPRREDTPSVPHITIPLPNDADDTLRDEEQSATTVLHKPTIFQSPIVSMQGSMGSRDPGRREEKIGGGSQYRKKKCKFCDRELAIMGNCRTCQRRCCKYRACPPRMQPTAGLCWKCIGVSTCPQESGAEDRSPLPKPEATGSDQAWPNNGIPSSGYISARAGSGDEAKIAKELQQEAERLKIDSAKAALEVRQLFQPYNTRIANHCRRKKGSIGPSKWFCM